MWLSSHVHMLKDNVDGPREPHSVDNECECVNSVTVHKSALTQFISNDCCLTWCQRLYGRWRWRWYSSSSEHSPIPAQFYYPGANVVQMRFLKLHSSTAIQKVTYSCHPGHELGETDRDVKFLTDTRKQSFLGSLKDCVVRISHSSPYNKLLIMNKYAVWCRSYVPACRGRCFPPSGVCVWVWGPSPPSSQRLGSNVRRKQRHLSLWLHCGSSVFQLEVPKSVSPQKTHIVQGHTPWTRRGEQEKRKTVLPSLPLVSCWLSDSSSVTLGGHQGLSSQRSHICLQRHLSHNE